MMNYLNNIYKQIDDIIPDEFIIDEVKTLLASSIKNGVISVEDESIFIKDEPEIFIVTKLIIRDCFSDFQFGPLRVEVSIGEANKENGLLKSEYFFISLYFTESLELTSYDYHFDFR